MLAFCCEGSKPATRHVAVKNGLEGYLRPMATLVVMAGAVVLRALRGRVSADISLFCCFMILQRLSKALAEIR